MKIKWVEAAITGIVSHQKLFRIKYINKYVINNGNRSMRLQASSLKPDALFALIHLLIPQVESPQWQAKGFLNTRDAYSQAFPRVGL